MQFNSLPLMNILCSALSLIIFGSMMLLSANAHEYPISVPEEDKHAWGYINKEGKFVVGAKYDFLMNFHCGRAFVHNDDHSTPIAFGPYYLIDKEGHKILSRAFCRPSDFSENLASVDADEASPGTATRELIDLFGKPAANNLDFISNFKDGIAVCQRERDWYIMKRDDFSLTKLNADTVASSWGDNLIWMRKDGKSFFCDPRGKIVISGGFSSAMDFSEGLAPVCQSKDLLGNGTWGFMNGKGEIVIKPEFAGVANFHNGLALAETKNSVGFIDRSGKFVKRFKRPFTLRDFHEGLAVIHRYYRWGYIDTTGKIVIPLKFEHSDDFSEGLAAATISVNGKSLVGFINRTGQWVIPPQFVKAQPFSEGLAAVCFQK